jgi:hypothetical protein
MAGWYDSGRESSVRSRADGRTAEQAEAMMDPLRKSLNDCTVSLSTSILASNH